MDLSLLLTQTKTAIDIAKFIKNGQDTLNKSEQKLKLAELIESLADIKMETAEIKSIIIEKDEKIYELEKVLSIKENLTYEAPYYWLNNDDDIKEGPYCQKCYDTDKKLIRLQALGTGEWTCNTCEKYVRDKNYPKANADFEVSRSLY